MPTVILQREFSKQNDRLDGSVSAAVLRFLAKLQKSDTSTGLHIEHIVGAADPRVRTGRITDFYRAVLYKVDNPGTEPLYIFLGALPHDDAIAYAKTVSVSVNPISGVAELKRIKAPDSIPLSRHETPPYTGETDADSATHSTAPSPANPPEEHTTTPVRQTGPVYPILAATGYTIQDLVGLGIDPEFAHKAFDARGEDELLDIADQAPAKWQGLAIISIGTGATLEEVREELLSADDGTDQSTADEPELVKALHHPASQLDFAFIEADEDLRAAIEDLDFAQWRVFLHPEQRRYVMRDRNGAFRLSGGAGTGKTVVLLHRARHLQHKNPDARIVLTTFNRTLAQSLDEGLETLDPELRRARGIANPGILVAGVDQLVMQVLRANASDFVGESSMGAQAAQRILGDDLPTREFMDVLSSSQERAVWEAAMAQAPHLPEALHNIAFLASEYSLVVLPNRITRQAEYLRARRPGRGKRLGRGERIGVWEAISQFRIRCAIEGLSTWDEKAQIAAQYLDECVGVGRGRPADSVLVDEAQDLSPSHLVFLRALARKGKNDLFLAEDSQQRIYGHKVVLSRYGIEIRGRSRRLSLNYRTTAENLAYSLSLLEGVAYEDMDGEAVDNRGYHSIRSGPEPRIVHCQSASEELEKLTATLQSWMDQHVEPGSIGVLCYANRTAEGLARHLTELGISAKAISGERPATPARKGTHTGHTKQGANEGSYQPDTAIQVMTMHRAKGMEFSRVVLFNALDDVDHAANSYYTGVPDEERDDYMQQLRSLIYVAASRARDELVVLTLKTS